MAHGFETRAIHDGQPPDPASGAVVPPITLSSTFVHEEVGLHSGYEYARSGNPTRRAYEECLASLEGALDGFAFASGMAAEDAVLRLLAPGQRGARDVDRVVHDRPPRAQRLEEPARLLAAPASQLRHQRRPPEFRHDLLGVRTQDSLVGPGQPVFGKVPDRPRLGKELVTAD
jgi:cystathionine beta-lyase/cystathionine gamma-synthase